MNMSAKKVQPITPARKIDLRIVRTHRVTIPVETESVKRKNRFNMDLFEQALVALAITCIILLAGYNLWLWLTGKGWW